jgi:hypothetical protein
MPVLCLKPQAISHPTKPTPQTAAAALTKDTDKLSDDSSNLSSIELMSSYESTLWGTPVSPAALSCRVSKRIQIKRPMGVGRKNLAELVDWDAELMVSIKVNQLTSISWNTNRHKW